MGSRKTKSDEPFPHQGDELHLLREIFRTYQVLIAGFASEVGMPASRASLIRQLAISEAGVGIAELARQLGINPAAVTRQVKDLESDRLVVRRADAKDGRRSYISLSKRGRKQFEEMHERSHEFERLLSLKLGAEDMQHAARVLSKLRTYIENRH